MAPQKSLKFSRSHNILSLQLPLTQHYIIQKQGFSNLRRLDIGNTQIDMTSLIRLFTSLHKNSKMEELVVDNPRIHSLNDEICVHLFKCIGLSNLRKVSAKQMQISDFALYSALSSIDLSNSSLKSLDLSINWYVIYFLKKSIEETFLSHYSKYSLTPPSGEIIANLISNTSCKIEVFKKVIY